MQPVSMYLFENRFLTCFWSKKASVKFGVNLATREMKEENLEALRANMDILIQ